MRDSVDDTNQFKEKNEMSDLDFDSKLKASNQLLSQKHIDLNLNDK